MPLSKKQHIFYKEFKTLNNQYAALFYGEASQFFTGSEVQLENRVHKILTLNRVAPVGRSRTPIAGSNSANIVTTIV